MRKPRPRPLADLIDACLGPTLAAQGFAASDILIAWPTIVGSRLNEACEPLKLQWPRRRWGAADVRPNPATLVVQVESAFAVELQHLAPLVIERVNNHYGWRCVGKLVLKQGPVRRAMPPAKAEPALSPEERARLDHATADLESEALRSALDRLGRAVIAGGGERGRPTKP